MSKPEDIPQDVWDAAKAIVYEPYFMEWEGIAAVAYAIIAAKADAFEQAASYHDELAVQHDNFRHDSSGLAITFHERKMRGHHQHAAAIRKLGSK